MPAEKNFERRIKKRLESVGVYALGTPVQNMPIPPIGYYEKRWGNKMTVSGLPDLHVVINGKSYEIEVKAPNGKANDLQKHIIQQINLCGCTAFVLYEHDEDIPNDDFGFYLDYQGFKHMLDRVVHESIA